MVFPRGLEGEALREVGGERGLDFPAGTGSGAQEYPARPGQGPFPHELMCLLVCAAARAGAWMRVGWDVSLPHPRVSL